jgi:hypothetical protein
MEGGYMEGGYKKTPIRRRRGYTVRTSNYVATITSRK